MATADPSNKTGTALTSSDTTATLVDLHDRLDNLWISYLHHLSEYTTAQSLLQKHMSVGFLSLARANFNSRTGVGRYGKDYFSDRAIASRRARIFIHDDSEKFKVNVLNWSEELEDSKDRNSVSEEDTEEAEKAKEQQPPPAPTPSVEADKDDLNNHESPGHDPDDQDEIVRSKVDSDQYNTSKSKTNSNIDPLRWFGILVPPELRSAQTSFTKTVDDSIARAVNAAKRIRELEIEIRRVRKEIRKAEKAGG